MLDGTVFQGRRVSQTANKESCLQRPSVPASGLEQDIVISQAVTLSAVVGGNRGTIVLENSYLSKVVLKCVLKEEQRTWRRNTKFILLKKGNRG